MNIAANSSETQTPRPTGKSRPRRFWLLAGTAVLLGLGAVILVGQQPKPMAATLPVAEERVMRLHPLEVTTVEPRHLEDRVNVTGTIEPAQQAEIAAQVSGLAEQVLVSPGDVVAEGDVLLEIGTTDLTLALRQQESTLETSMVQLRAAETTLTRTEELVDRELAATTTLDSARAEVDRLRASIATLETQVAQAETNLGRAVIRAPFDGIVSARSIEPGQTVSQGTPLLGIVDLSRVKVEVIAPLSDTADIAPGQPVQLSVQGQPERLFAATVDRINPVAEEGTRSVKVYLSLENPDGALRGGMFVTGAIVTRQADDVLAVPATAIRTENDASFVLAIADGALERRDVGLGANWSGETLVEVTGIAAGDEIVSTDLPQLSAGMAVTIEGR